MPGPWIVRERWYIGREDTGTFAEVKCCDGLPVDAEETHEANARLIAAAPELLAACEGIASEEFANAHEEIEYGPGGTSDEAKAQKLIDERMAAVRAAIAKAKDGAS